MDVISIVITAIAALTAVGILYVNVKNRQDSRKQLKLSVKPNLWLNSVSQSNGYQRGSHFKGELNFDILNNGETATMLELKLNSNDVLLHNLHLPRDIENGGKWFFSSNTKGQKSVQSCEYEIDIIYSDKLENRYLSKIKGKGTYAKIVETSEIK